MSKIDNIVPAIKQFMKTNNNSSINPPITTTSHSISEVLESMILKANNVEQEETLKRKRENKKRT